MVLSSGLVAMAVSLLSGMVMIGVGFCCLGQGHHQSTGNKHGQGDQPNVYKGGWHRIEVLDTRRPYRSG